MTRSRVFAHLVVALTLSMSPASVLAYDPVAPNGVVDLTPTVYTNRVQWWPGGHEQPIIVPYHKWGPDGPWASDLLIVDENTANQVDCPPHMVPPLEKIRERRQQFVEKPDRIVEILHEGSRRARTVAARTMEEVRSAVHLTP